MIARAGVVAEADGRGGTRLASVRSVAPLAVRATPGAVYFVGGAAGPLGGDDLRIDLQVGPGAELTVRTAAASVVLPGPGISQVTVVARVAAGGRLRWLPEPTVLVRNCRHRIDADVCLDQGAALEWREELVMGRYEERPGSVVSRTRIDLGGRPLLRQELRAGPDEPAWATPAVAARARALGSVVLVDPAWAEPGRQPASALLGPTAAVLPLAGPAVQVTALAPDPRALRGALEAGVNGRRPTGDPRMVTCPFVPARSTRARPTQVHNLY